MEGLVLHDDKEDGFVFSENVVQQAVENYDMCLVGSRLYLFRFFHEIDVCDYDVLRGGPWSYDNHLLVLHRMKPGEMPMEVPLFYADFWINIYNLHGGFR